MAKQKKTTRASLPPFPLETPWLRAPLDRAKLANARVLSAFIIQHHLGEAASAIHAQAVHICAEEIGARFERSLLVESMLGWRDADFAAAIINFLITIAAWDFVGQIRFEITKHIPSAREKLRRASHPHEQAYLRDLDRLQGPRSRGRAAADPAAREVASQLNDLMPSAPRAVIDSISDLACRELLGIDRGAEYIKRALWRERADAAAHEFEGRRAVIPRIRRLPDDRVAIVMGGRIVREYNTRDFDDPAVVADLDRAVLEYRDRNPF